MSNEKTPTPPKAPPPHVAMKLRAFPVDYIKALPGADFDVPGKLGSSITSERDRENCNRDHHFIEYVPDMDVFAVTCVRSRVPSIVFIPSRNVRSWAPLL